MSMSSSGLRAACTGVSEVSAGPCRISRDTDMLHLQVPMKKAKDDCMVWMLQGTCASAVFIQRCHAYALLE